MSELIPFKGQKIAKAFAGIAHGPALGEQVQTGFSWIGIRGKTWSLRHAGHTYPFVRPDDGSPLTYLDFIIVGQQTAVSKAYYAGEFSEDSSGPPVCTSVHGDVPDPGVSIKQSDTCPSCKWYGFGTKPNGQPGKACQDHIKLAVLLLPDLTKKLLGAPLLEPVYFKVPPASMVALKAYGEELKDEGYPHYSVVTRVGFRPPPKLFEMKFEGIKTLTEKEAEFIKPMLDSPLVRRIIGNTTEIREMKQVAGEKLGETGLIEAFTNNGGSNGKPAAEKASVKRGRPKVVETKVEEPEEETPPTEAASAPAESQWDETDSATDKAVDDVLSKSLKDMFP